MALEYSAEGLRQLGVVTGLMAAGAGANSEIFQLRNTSGKNIRLLYAGLSVGADATGFAAGTAVFDIIKATAWSAQGTGGTAIALTAPELLDHTNQNPSRLVAGDVRVATTAPLGAGTKTLNASAIQALVCAVPVAAGSVLLYPQDLFVVDGPDFIPFTIANNEGIVIRATVPATGTWRAGVNVAWSEVA